MNKKVNIGMLVILLFQFLSPIVEVAQAVDLNSTLAEPEIRLRNLELGSSEINVNQELPIEITVEGDLKEKQDLAMTVSSNFQLNPTVQDLKNSEGLMVGNYQVSDNQLQLHISKETKGELKLAATVKVMNQKNKQETLTISLGKQDISKEVKIETKEQKTLTSPSHLEGITQKTDPSVAAAKDLLRAGPQNISQLFPSETGQNSLITKLEIVDKNGNQVTEMKVGDELNFSLDFVLPEDIRQQMSSGDFFEFELSDKIKIDQNQSYELKNADGIVYGVVEINTSGKVVITFNDQIEKESNIIGDFHFGGTVNQEALPGPGDVVIETPFVDGQPGVEITVKPNITNSIDKKGHFDRLPNPDKIIWNVDINKALDHLTNAMVHENFPKGTVYESIKVYQVKVDFKGNVVENSEIEVSPSEYEVDDNGNVTFNHPIDGAYRIEYTTKIEEDKKPGAAGGDVPFINEASLTADELEEALETEATVTASYKKALEKGEPNYHPETQTFDWTIKYNHDEEKIKQSQATVSDTITGNMVLKEDSVVINRVTFDENGKEIIGAPLVPDVDYHLTPRADGKGFDLIFDKDLDYAVNINYTTQVTEEVTGDSEYTNSVEDGHGNKDQESGHAKQQGLIKYPGDVDYGAKVVSWHILVNQNNYQMENWQMTDTLGSGLTLVDRRFSIIDQTTGEVLLLDKDFSMEYDTENNQFKVIFLGEYVHTNHAFEIHYATHFDVSELEGNSFSNQAVSDWISETDNSHKNPGDTAEFKPNPEAKNNGFKSGEYNAVSKEITWTLGMNYSKVPLKQAKVVDKMTGNQKYVPDSLEIYHYTIASDGSYVIGDELTPAEYKKFIVVEPNEKNEQTLTIHVPNNIAGNAQFAFKYRTSLVGEVINSSDSYTNKAQMHNSGEPTYEVVGKVSVANGGSFAKKEGKQDADGYLNWSVTVNPSQSTMKDVVVKDDPSTNQIIDEQSVILYQTIVDEKGKITKGEPLDKSHYIVALTTNNETGKQHLEVKLSGEITTSYLLEYRSMVFFDEGQTNGKANNDVYVSGVNIETVGGGQTVEENIHISNGGGTANGQKGSISFRKQDDTGKILTQGARFELWNLSKTVKLREGKVGGDGVWQVGSLPYGKYVLKEVAAPSGTTISDQLVAGQEITIDANSSKAGSYYNVVNQRSQLLLTKISEEGQLLSGAEFKIEKLVNGDWQGVTTEAPIKSDSKGNIDVRGLTEGQYQMIETKAPTAPKEYMLNTAPIPFIITKNAAGQLVVEGAKQVINYLGTIEFKKVNQADFGLAGAVFKVVRVENSAGNKVNETITTTLTSSENGQVKLDKLSPGKYQLTEIQAPKGYLLNTETINFIIGKESVGKPDAQVMKDFKNYQGSVQLKKVSEGNNPLAGATFEIRQNAQIIKTVVSNSQGQVFADELAPGTYQIVETKAPAGYLLNTEVKNFTIVSSSQGAPETIQLGNFYNYLGSAKLLKVNGQGERLVGAEFTLTDERQQVLKVIESDDRGVVAVNDLAPGKYLLTETKAPLQKNGEPYVLNTYPVNFEIPSSYQGKPQIFDLGQYQNYKGKLKLTKEGNGTTLGGAEFSIYREGVDEPVKTGVISDETGLVDYGDLGPGNYKMIETKAPAGFVINSNPIYFVVQEKQETEQIIDEGSFENYQMGIAFRKLNPSGEELTGAEFELYKLDKETHERKLVSKLVEVNDEGFYHYEGLDSGDYEIKEIKAPMGYIINTEPLRFSIDTEYLNQPETLVLNDFVNYQGSAKLVKLGKNGQALKGAEFSLTNKDGKVIETITSDSKGVVSFTNIAPGEYLIRETKAPLGYILNTKELVLKIAEQEEGEPKELDLAQYFNYQGSAQLVKSDQEDLSQKLSGAIFDLVDSQGNVLQRNLTTDSQGKLSVSDLIPGKYAFVETKAPVGYVLDQGQHSFEILAEAENQPETVVVKVTNKKKVIVPDKPVKPNEGHSHTPAGNLPQTGEQKNYLFVLLGGVLVVGIGGIWFYRSKNQE